MEQATNQEITATESAQEPKKKQNLIKVMTDIIKKENKLVYYLGAFYLYKDGYYQRQEEEIFLSLIKERLSDEHKDYETAYKVYKSLKIEKGVILDTDDTRIEPKHLICFKNCLYNPFTGDTFTHTPELIFFTQTPHNFNVSAETDDITEHLFNNFIKGYDEHDKIKLKELLFQTIGVALSNDRTFKNFFYIQGQPDTGKSTYCGLIQRILGKGMFSSIPINALNESGTDLFTIADKKANIITEATSKSLNDEVITTMKKLTGGSEEVISCRIKYLNTVEVKSRALLIFAGNSVPSLWSSGDLSAFIKRMILIDFRGQIQDKDKIDNILDKVNYEYIIAESMRAFKRFIDNNKVFTIPSVVIENRIKLKNDNPVNAFISECSVVSDYKIHARNLYAMFQRYCNLNGCSNGISQIAFSKKIEQEGFTKKKVKETDGDKRSYEGFEGLKPPKEFLDPHIKDCQSRGLSC